MTTTLLDVSVIICAYTTKRWPALVAAIESVHQQVGKPRETIVVIDHNPELFELALNHLPDVIVIENREPAGLSGARNSGIALAQGAFVAFLDDDATAEPDWLLQLYQLCANPNVLGVGGDVVPNWIGVRPRWFPDEFSWVIGCSYRGLPRSLAPVRNPYGGNICMRRDIFAVIGGFRNGLGRIGTHPLGGEETELSIRAKQHWPQRIFLYEPRAKIRHRVESSRATWRYFLARCYWEGFSKAAITRIVGTHHGLASERSYVWHTLPLGVLRGLGEVLRNADANGLLRAAAIVMGLTWTVIGYMRGTLVPGKTTPMAALIDDVRKIERTPALLLVQKQVVSMVPSYKEKQVKI